MHRLFARQLAKAASESGDLDIARLAELVTAAYEQAENDRRRTDRSISLMVDDLEHLNRGLERTVAERTAALSDRESRFANQNMLFDAALNNMSQGLLMFDPQTRIMIYNRRYLEIYGLDAAEVSPGMTLEELLHRRVANGTYKGDPAGYANEVKVRMRTGETFSRATDLPDGRTISVVSRPLGNGGWVVTHEDVSERRRAERQVVHMAHHDSLTDLPNRALFHDRLQLALSHVQRGQRIAILYLDLDNFKGVNDTFGHHAGDALLKNVACRLRTVVRETDTVARVGGDEFAIIQVDVETPAETGALATRICEALNAPYDLNGNRFLTEVSIGIAMAPLDGETSDDLLKNADLALYRAKADGRGTYRFFEPGMDARVKARRALENELRIALASEQFEVYYQPIFDLKTNNITCCEALVRWQHPKRGTIAPSEFIAVAEEIGLIGQLGEWVLRKACADAAAWPENIKVAVNLSPLQVTSSNLVPTIIGALAAAAMPASRLELEITESVMMQNTEATLAALHRIREIGVKICMDDFGTGYSSLSYLRRFPFEKLKIDRSFIGDLSTHDNAQTIVLAVITMARSLGMITTAEGVETREQLDQIRALGCTQAQGYYLSRPVQLETINAMIERYAPRQLKTA